MFGTNMQNTLKSMMEYAKANPESDYAKTLFTHITSGAADEQATKEGIDLTKFGRPKLEKKGLKGFVSRVGADYKEAGNRIVESVKKGAEDYQTNVDEGDVLGATGALTRSGLRTVGGVAEAAVAPILEVPVIKKALDFVGKKIGNTETGKKVANVIEKYPEASQDIMDIVNVLTLGGGRVVEKPFAEGVGAGLKKTGTALEKSGVNAAESNLDTFVRDLVRPEQTKAIKEAQVARTTEKGIGPFKKSVIEPTSQELASENAVKTIKGVSPKNTNQQNFNIIKEANIQEALKLESDIAKNDFIIPRKEVVSRLTAVKKDLAKSPVLVGDAEKTADKLLAAAIDFVKKNEGKGSGLLKAKKEYDAWVLSQKPKVFDSTSENAFTIANREVRNVFKDILDENAPSVGVKQSLAKQHSLHNAMDNIAPKAAIEADTAIGRAFQNMANAVGIKNKLVQQVAAIAGIGGLGAAATFAPAAALTGGLGFLAYQGGKLVLKPQLRTALGKLLKEAGGQISKEEGILINSFLQGIEKELGELPKSK